MDILEKKAAENPQDHRYHSYLGKAYAGLGNGQEALEHGREATPLLPVDKDAMIGPLRLEDLARIYVMLSKDKDAIDILESLLKMRSELTARYLKLDPVWRPLDKHNRFKNLIE